MEAQYVVIDADGNTSLNDDEQEPESFALVDEAKERAAELALANPGKPIRIYALVYEAKVPVGSVEFEEF